VGVVDVVWVVGVMIPDYQLIHGDCKEILPTLAGIYAIVSDVPYGMDYKPGGYMGTLPHGSLHRAMLDPVYGDNEPFDPAHLLAYPKVALFGAHHYSDKLPQSRGWLVWDKKPNGWPKNNYSDGDLIWTNQDKPLRIFRYLWQGALRQGGDNSPHLHPTEKPVALMKWIIEQLDIPAGAVICDPYMGSGTTGVACAELGYDFVGIEILPKYFEMAEARIEKAYKQPPLSNPPLFVILQPEQLTLLQEAA
jgi:site-specific DNA-methyltransferase (adenine-specific)